MPTSDTTSTPATALDASAKKDTRSDSLISLELQAPSSNHLDDPEAVDRRQQVASYQVPTWKAVFLIFRSLVGIGVLTMPHAVQSFGVNGALILLPIFTVGILYVLDLVLRIANDLGFNGSNIDELIVKSGNEKWRNTFSIINNWMMIAGGVANCIFAGRSPTSHSHVPQLGCLQSWMGYLWQQDHDPSHRLCHIYPSCIRAEDELLCSLYLCGNSDHRFHR